MSHNFVAVGCDLSLIGSHNGTQDDVSSPCLYRPQLKPRRLFSKNSSPLGTLRHTARPLPILFTVEWLGDKDTETRLRQSSLTVCRPTLAIWIRRMSAAVLHLMVGLPRLPAYSIWRICMTSHVTRHMRNEEVLMTVAYWLLHSTCSVHQGNATMSACNRANVIGRTSNWLPQKILAFTDCKSLHGLLILKGICCTKFDDGRTHLCGSLVNEQLWIFWFSLASCLPRTCRKMFEKHLAVCSAEKECLFRYYVYQPIHIHGEKLLEVLTRIYRVTDSQSRVTFEWKRSG